MLKNYSKVLTIEAGIKYYLNDKRERHCLDGPAVENSYGTKHWYINGTYHRNIDPAAAWLDGLKVWWFKDKRHRIGGSYNSVYKAWYIHDKEYAKEEYFNIVWNI